MRRLTCSLGDRAKRARASLLTIATAAAEDDDFNDEEVVVAMVGGRGVDVVASSLYIHSYE